jgi:predicted transcriptional regulator
MYVQSGVGSQDTILVNPDLEKLPHNPTMNISFTNFLSSLFSLNMPSKAITSRRETTIEKRADVWAWYKVGKTYNEIRRLTELTKLTIANIIQREKKRIGQDRFSNVSRPGKPPKLTPKVKRRLLRATFKNTQAILKALFTLSKSGKQLSKTTVRKILK